MGASKFISIANGENAKEAFYNAQQKASYEYGHGGYTGTIAEKDSFVMITTTDEIFETYELAHLYAKQLLHDEDARVDNKHGPAGCIKFKDANEIKYMFFGWARS